MRATWRARTVLAAGVVALGVIALFPFLWMALSSIKTLGELYTVPPVWLPEIPTLENYRRVLFDSNVPRRQPADCVGARSDRTRRRRAPRGGTPPSRS